MHVIDVIATGTGYQSSMQECIRCGEKVIIVPTQSMSTSTVRLAGTRVKNKEPLCESKAFTIKVDMGGGWWMPSHV